MACESWGLSTGCVHTLQGFRGEQLPAGLHGPPGTGGWFCAEFPGSDGACVCNLCWANAVSDPAREPEAELICSETCLGRCVTSAWGLSQGSDSSGVQLIFHHPSGAEEKVEGDETR